ncbi:murein L,D-transpeptidase catalytic domain family protein [Hymenobacter sp. HSC-4F20]|uniref:murein L,D-transpeptidase catalytic domain family protein n=1 Tax=Hymenobacter sp. HSC-4F20 TaxID=2864135 RepID=UPI001C73993E|nr:murein L,D-transpeptidase catalytic domain family protein [Hymenobacter sp. HSC-4F20]MBX0289780.1 murein L,D-transpeptidase catalytic domain family protein [Hymenobacter sp. HSC-4F20]
MTNVLTRAAAFLLLTVFSLPASWAAVASPRTNAPAATSNWSAQQRAMVTAAFEQHVALSYVQAGLTAAGLSLDVYRRALIGFYSLQQRGTVSSHAQVLSIIDFGRSSTQKRLWIIDLAKGKLLHHSLVAHGKNTGEEYAQSFSNREGSEMSSLGFYVTGATYQGKHGLSLKLNGVDAGYNTNALTRAVVVHGADYVSQQFIRQHGRLGRSQGCPALPVADAPAIIRTIKGGTVLFANGPASIAYRSAWLSLDPALLGFARSKGLLDRIS